MRLQERPYYTVEEFENWRPVLTYQHFSCCTDYFLSTVLESIFHITVSQLFVLLRVFKWTHLLISVIHVNRELLTFKVTFLLKFTDCDLLQTFGVRAAYSPNFCQVSLSSPGTRVWTSWWRSSRCWALLPGSRYGR